MRKITKWFLCLVLVMAVVCGAMTAFAQEQTYVAENVQTGQQYADLTTAALSATEGQTVKLLQNAEAQMLTVVEDTTLDLNGYELKAVYASVFGHMVDTSAANTGALKVDASKLLINTANKQLPVKTDKGYQFVEVVGFNTAWMNENTFVFQPMFEAAANTLLKNGVANTGVTIQVNVTWKPYEGSEDLDSRTFKYGDNFVTQFVNSYNAATGKYGKMFTLTLVNPQNYVDLSCSVQVVSTTRVVFAPAPAPAEVTEEVQLVNEQASAIVPVGTKLKNAGSELTLTTEELDTTTVVVGDGEEARSMDIHVEGLAKDNTVPVIVTVNEMAPEFMNRGNITLYHVENGEAVEMTRVYTVEEVDEHNEFYYDIETGTVTMAMASFSEVTAVSSSDNGWNGKLDYTWYDAEKTQLRIANADQLAGFGAIVGGMAKDENGELIARDTFAGKTVTLIADINIGDLNSENGIVFYPIGYHSTDLKYEKTGVAVTTGFYNFEGTFDGNGNTISNFYQNTWEMKGDHDWYSAAEQYYRDGFGLFGKVYGGTVKNLIVDNFSCDSEIGTAGTIAAYADGAKFENITIFNCNPRVYNIGNGGIVGCVGWYAKQEGLKTTFTNITVDQTNKVSALWGTYDASCGGILGQYYPTSGQSAADYPVNGGIHFKNCHVAAIMDVNNDVCANYQYYWYRYSGMLLGSVRTNTTDGGYTVADTSGIKAENCTYTYGSWNEYWYCELVKNSSASYTHDYQFGRLTNIDSLSEISADGAWLKEGNFALVSADRKSVECYHIFKDSNGNLYRHFHDEADESNPNIYEDFDLNGDGLLNDLKEDRQRYYLPFGQVMNGYGWGVKPIYEFEGFTLVKDGSVLSGEKFQIKKGAELTYTPGQTIKLSDIVDLTIDSSKLSQSSLYASASPVVDTDNVTISYVRDNENWLNNTITFSDSSVGDAKLVITDHFYCEPTVIILKQATTVAKIGDKEYTSLQDALNAAQDGETVTLVADVKASKYLDIYTPNNGETERSITLDLAGNSITWSDNYKYAYYPLVFVGINQTLTIKNGSITADEHVAVGAYGHVNLENVNVSVKNPSKGEQAVCIWNWSEDDTYFQDCQFLITGSATITGGEIIGGILAEGTVTFEKFATDNGDVVTTIDELYLNTKTGYGKVTLPDGYGMVKESGYYTNLHKHNQDNEGACSICGFSASYVKTDIANIKSTDIVIVTMTKGETTWALSSANGTKDDPVAVVVEVDGNKLKGEPDEAIKWNLGGNSSGYIFYPNGSTTTWLYSTNDNDGTRVGTNVNKTWVIDAASGYLKHLGTSRYLGVYTVNPDWRSYINTTGNTAGQTLAFYVLKTNCTHENMTEPRGEIAATCTETGHEEGVYCLGCDTYISGGKLIDAPGHDFKLTSVKEATCAKDGKEIYHCTVCNKVSQKTIKVAHTWTEATCQAPKTCSVCNITEGEKNPDAHTFVDGKCACGVKEVEEYTVTYKVGTATYKEEETTNGQLTVIAGPEVEGDYTFVGWVDAKFNTDTATVSVAYVANNSYEFEDDTTLYAVYSYEKESEAGEKFIKVTNTSDLKVGNEVVIVASASNVAMSTTQNNNNRGQASVTKNNTDNTVSWDGNSVQILTLEQGTKDGTWAFYTGSGYLYAAGSNKNNYLRTQTANTADGSWAIEFTSTGAATIKAQGTNTNNWMRYNSSNKLFACYGSGQAEICIYMKSGGIETLYTTNVTMPCVHIWNDGAVTAPTCTEAGYTTYTCNLCGEENKADEKPATGHLHTVTNTVDATCSVAGSVTEICEACGVTVSTQVIPIKEHSWNEGTITAPATCKPGVKTFTCGACSTTKTESIPATGEHVWVKQGTVAPTCTAKGYTTYKCSACNETKQTDEVAATGHQNTAESTVAATCTKDGSITVSCVDCGMTISTQVIKAKGHSVTSGVCPDCGDDLGGQTTKKFKKVTSISDITDDGQYLIVYESGKVAFDGSRSTLDATSNTKAVKITDGIIEDSPEMEAITFIIAKSGNSYTVKSQSGYYIGQSSNANGLKSSETTTYATTITFNSDGTVNFVSGGAYLRFNASSDQMRFRYYKSSSYTGQKAICLYKLVEEKI